MGFACHISKPGWHACCERRERASMTSEKMTSETGKIQMLVESFETCTTR
jgi:hypothetical protein